MCMCPGDASLRSAKRKKEERRKKSFLPAAESPSSVFEWNEKSLNGFWGGGTSESQETDVWMADYFIKAPHFDVTGK